MILLHYTIIIILMYIGGRGVRWQRWAAGRRTTTVMLLLYTSMHKPICTPFSFFSFRRFPAGNSRIPTRTCRYVYTSVSTPRGDAGRVWECSRSVYHLRERLYVCGRIGEGKENKRKPAEAARQFGRVLCGRHVGHIAGERGFLMTTRSIGSMVPPPPVRTPA